MNNGLPFAESSEQTSRVRLAIQYALELVQMKRQTLEDKYVNDGLLISQKQAELTLSLSSLTEAYEAAKRLLIAQADKFKADLSTSSATEVPVIDRCNIKINEPASGGWPAEFPDESHLYTSVNCMVRRNGKPTGQRPKQWRPGSELNPVVEYFYVESDMHKALRSMGIPLALITINGDNGSYISAKELGLGLQKIHRNNKRMKEHANN